MFFMFGFSDYILSATPVLAETFFAQLSNLE